ncbi:MAG: hypothetical protein K6U89_03655 [Chloroflexi bacterium]|nr:hypothetical protein [Chloroflexota bacterium]
MVYAGAGSHAAYFRPGEYLTEVPVTLFRPLVRAWEVVRSVWVRGLRQPDTLPVLREITIPFVDYAWGDGVAVGPGQEREWHPIVLTPEMAWVEQYHGLFGRYVHDPLGGENAPSGPKFNRDGSIRQAWADPVGWAGLEATPPPPQALAAADQAIATLAARQGELTATIAARAAAVEEQGSVVQALRAQSALASRAAREAEQLRTQRQELAALRREQAENAAMLAALQARREQLARGELDPPRSHLRRLALPASPASLRARRLVELWAAASIALFLLVTLLILAFARQWAVLGIAGLLTVFVFIEALLRRQLASLVASFTVLLAVVAAGVLVVTFFWPLVFLIVLAAALFLLWENVRELRA